MAWKLRNKFQLNSNRNSNIFTDENTFENVVGKMSAILSRPRCIKERGNTVIATFSAAFDAVDAVPLSIETQCQTENVDI